MNETDHLVLNRERMPSSVAVGQELDVLVRGRVRRIEADQIDVRGFNTGGALAVLEGEVFVELTVLASQVSIPAGHTPVELSC